MVLQQRPTSSRNQPVLLQQTLALQFQATSQTTSFQTPMVLQQRPTSSRDQPVSSQQTLALQFQAISKTTTTSYLPKPLVSCPQPQYPSLSKLWAISHLFITVLPKANIDVFRMWTTTKRRYSNTNGAQGHGHSFKDDKNGTPQSKFANVYFRCNNTVRTMVLVL